MSVEIQDLTVEFKNKTKGVQDLTLTIPKGIYGLLGENGAGKTTLMRTLTTILKPSKGRIFLNGIPYEERYYKDIQRKIGYLPQELNLYPNLTVKECLEYLGELSGIPKGECKRRAEEYLEKTNMSSQQRKKLRQLSGGMKRRVGLIQALMHNPEFLIVDEPTTGLDPEERIRIRNLLVDFSVGRTVLFSTHVVEDLAATCSRLAVMKKGRLLFQGPVQELISKARGHVFLCRVSEEEARKLEERYLVSSKQYTEHGIEVRILSGSMPEFPCREEKPTLEDAYIYQMGKSPALAGDE